MYYKAKHNFWFLLLLTTVFLSCKNQSYCDIEYNDIFNEDSAYLYIKNQVDFGARIPNTKAHDSCVLFLENKLQSFGAKVITQNTELERFDGLILNSTNIIAEFYPDKKRRILLFAHYDSRYYSDMEADNVDQLLPVLGANDGASGVGVLLEVARQVSVNEPTVGIDIIFFDAEDQGQPLYMDIYDEKAWCLGAQYWAKNPHVKNYDALFGLGLDMVGGNNPVFAKDDNSRYFNNFLVKKVWRLADSLGYGSSFPNMFSKPILHDHVFVSQLAGIRSIMIMDNDPHKTIPYFEQWHTQQDNLQNINKQTLKMVGDVVLNFIYCVE